MNILMIYPKYPDTFWSYKHVIKFISKKALLPPLGLITIASLLPKSWNKKLIDLNIHALKQKDLQWADLVFISAMSIQKASADEVIELCKKNHKTVVAGGPHFTEEYHDYPEVDHLILNEGEITLKHFLQDYIKGNTKRIYQTNEFPDIRTSPLPMFDLLDMKKYATLSIQYTRGCPFNCEFCDVTALFGHKVRIKETTQIMTELNQLYDLGWRGDLFFVDDNFIGNKKILKRELLPELIIWMRERKYPFRFITEASINLADDEDLMKMMIAAGFVTVFIGIETPNIDSLVECSKVQNVNRDLLESVETIQQHGFQVTAGFIVGFDHDSHHVFQQQIDFIQKSGIVTAMVGLLNAPTKSHLYERLFKENRIIKSFTGDNTDFSINFTPKMGMEKLMNGYRSIIHEIYSHKPYYKRVKRFLKRFNPPSAKASKTSWRDIKALFRSVIVLGALRKGRIYYWKLFFWALFFKPEIFTHAITYSIFGYHFRRVFSEQDRCLRF